MNPLNPEMPQSASAKSSANVKARLKVVRRESATSQNRTVTPASQRESAAHLNVEVEEDLETVLDLAGEIIPYDDTGKRTYEKACRKLGVVPSSNCIRKLTSSKVIDLHHYGLGPKGTMTISLAMVVNSRVTALNLSGNDIGKMGILYIQKMMTENRSITDLAIADNKLGTFGAKTIGLLLEDNKVLRRLDISGNEFMDMDCEYITKRVEDHSGLRYLNLSHNNFGDISARAFEEMIAENGALHELDISWNQFRIVGARHIANGVKENAFLRTLDVSWNGFDDDGAAAMADALKNNSVLTELDMSCNRIGAEGFLNLVKSLGSNDTLLHLRVGRNNILEDAAVAAIELLKTFSSIHLKTLDLSEVILCSRFKDKLPELYESHTDLKVTYGYTDSYGKKKAKSFDVAADALTLLKNFLDKSNLKLMDLFNRFDSDGSNTITHAEFKEGLKEVGLHLSPLQLDCLIESLDEDNDGEVDFSELLLALANRERESKK